MTLTGGTFNPEPIRFTYTPGAMALAGGSLEAGPGLAVSDGERLARLQRQQTYFDDVGRPTAQMQQHWQRTMERLEARFTDIETVLAQIQAAQTMAAAAQQNVLTVAGKVDLANSYTSPVSGVVSATSDGVVTVTSHSRVYGDGTSVAVNGGTLSGFATGSFVRVYYSDPARSGGAVTYMGSTGDVIQQGSTHVVGGVAIPALGSPTESGAPFIPPGYVRDYR